MATRVSISVRRWIWIAVFAAVLGAFLAGLLWVDSSMSANETQIVNEEVE